MMTPDTPIDTDIVLIGGGHANVFVLKSFGMKPVPGVRLTLISKELNAPYSGMLPGMVAGHYTEEDCHINLVRLARHANARLIHGVAIGLDRAQRRVVVADRPPVPYDMLSIDVGITPDLSSIVGAEEHALAVKPVSDFTAKWRALETRILQKPCSQKKRLVVVGGGAAGFELATAANHRLVELQDGNADNVAVTLIAGTKLLGQHSRQARRLAFNALEARNIEVIEGERALSIDTNGVQIGNGRIIAGDATLVATDAQAPFWFKKIDLPLSSEGYIAVRPTLQVEDDDDIFAVGDCASIIRYPRPKSGVFAVRQGPVLTNNLRARLARKPLKEHKPQSKFLTLLSIGEKSAIASRGSFAISGDWVWKWKDWIDRRFMDRFNGVPWMLDEEPELASMRCAGCAAKVGPSTLQNALNRLGRYGTSAVPINPTKLNDDATIIDSGGPQLTLETVDFFRAFWSEPYLLGEIAANHALSDIYAMGGLPDRAMAIAMLPYAAVEKIEDDLFQLLAGARSVFDREGVLLAGGHSAEGQELGIGFFVSGSVKRDQLIEASAPQPGDRLILSKPVGTGLLLAAEMRGRLSAYAFEDAIASMRQTNLHTSKVLANYRVSAATDVTGFGLAGHLLEMLQRKELSATIDMNAVPLLPSVLDLAKAGLMSSLVPQNRKLDRHLEIESGAVCEADLSVLFDPQTSGGLLFSIRPEEAEDCLAELRNRGAPDASIIGDVGSHSSGTLQKLHVVRR